MHLEQRHLPFTVMAAVLAVLAVFISNRVTEKDEPVAALSLNEQRIAFRLIDDLILASASIAAERGLALAALSAVDPMNSPEREALKEHRQASDRASSAVQKGARQLPSTMSRRRIVARVESAYETLTFQRSEVEQDARRPAHQRGVHAVFRSFQIATTVINAMQELLHEIHGELKATNPSIAGWLEIQGLSLEMAEHAGRERAQVAVFLAASGRAAKAQLTAAEYNRHKVLSNWTQIRSTLADLVPPHPVAAQVVLVEERYFAPHIQMRQFLLGSRPPDRHPMSAIEWFRQATLGIDAMVDFSRAVGAAATQSLPQT
jgi:hypothetical protein